MVKKIQAVSVENCTINSMEEPYFHKIIISHREKA